MERSLFGLANKDIRCSAFEFAEADKFNHHFSTKSKLTAEDWLAGIMKRHPELSDRAAESTSLARATGLSNLIYWRN